MKFFSHIIAAVRARKAKAVVKSFTWYLRAHSAETTSYVLDFYQTCALHAIKKTEENEQPLADLVLAMDAVLKHYGPGLITEFEAFKQRMSEVEHSSLVAQRRALLDDALSDALEETKS